MMRYPLLFPLSCFVVGILLGGFYPLAITNIGLVFGLSAITLVGLLWKRAWQNMPVFALLFFAAGLLLTSMQSKPVRAEHYVHLADNKMHVYAARLEEYPVPTARAIRFEVALQSDESGNPISGKVYVFAPVDSHYYNLLPGDELLFEARLNPLEPPKNPHEFDYQNYLHLHGVYAQTYTREIKVLSHSKRSVYRFTASARNRLLRIIRQFHFNEEEIAVASALLLGYRHLVTDETTRAFSGSGAMHVLAVSGLHVGILYMIVAFLLRIDRRKPQHSNGVQVFFTIGVIWGYALLTGLSPSVTRAAVMFTFVSIGYLRQHKAPVIQSLLVSAFVLLAYNPNYLFEVGFQLSYAAVFGIVYLQRDIRAYFPQSKFWLLNSAYEICAVSIAAQLGTFPLSMYYFHQFPVYFLASNLIVIPAAFLAMSYGILLLFYASIFPAFAWMALPLKWILDVMIESVRFVQNLPNAVVEGLWLGREELLLLTLLVFVAADAFWRKRKKSMFLALGLGVLLLMLNVGNALERKNANQLLIYSVADRIAIEHRHATQSTLLSDSILLADEEAMLFHIQHNLWAGGVKKPAVFYVHKDAVSDKLILQNGVLEIARNRILLYWEAVDSLKFTLKPNIVLVARNVPPPKKMPDSQVVLLSGLRPTTIARWQQLRPEAHDLGRSGAFVLNLFN